ncbi:hypothetical protein [Hymenobacter guriensis]|uniref:STAS/SEC14 domain-containing protein n=1 Tax=Hymenobacter guriensis TaxID=2793065 RepID=A0ABS0L816_9BACT|nr:hypothetical protein [Hymenobacter guriensis]MBG8556291.1 hypothetical protein [Hymenobacter guriensis]
MIAPHLYFSNAVGSVLFVPKAFAYLHFSGESMTSQELRALYVHAANLLARYQLYGILADHRAMPAAFEVADRQWLLTEWLPNTIPTPPPIVRYAVLPQDDPARRLHTDHVLHQLRELVHAATFTDLEQAAAWLHSEGQAHDQPPTI